MFAISSPDEFLVLVKQQNKHAYSLVRIIESSLYVQLAGTQTGREKVPLGRGLSREMSEGANCPGRNVREIFMRGMFRTEIGLENRPEIPGNIVGNVPIQMQDYNFTSLYIRVAVILSHPG